MAKFESKYFINGISLKDYCLLHNYSYASARKMISSNHRKHPKWSDEKVLSDVVKRLKASRTKYYFAGTTLNKYCKEHGIVSSTARRIYQKLASSLKEEFSEEDIMEKAIELAKRGHEKYSVEDVKLSLYCEENGINKGSIISAISSYRKSHPESELSDEEVVKAVLQHFRSGYSTYYVGDETFCSYVLRHGYNPSSVLRKLQKIHPEIKSLERKISIDENCVQEVMQSMQSANGTLYFYDGIPLRQYCLENGLNYNSVFGTMTKNPTTSLDEIIENAIANKARRIRQRDRITLKEKENDEIYVREYIIKYGIDMEQYKMLRHHFGPFAAISAIEYFGSCDQARIVEIFEAISKKDKSLDDAILLVNLGFHENAYHVVKNIEGFIINTIKEVTNDVRKYQEYREYLEEYIYTLLVDRCYLFTPAGFMSYLKKSLKHILIEYIKKKCVSLKEFGLDASYSTDKIFEKREKLAMVRDALNCLSEWELTYVYRRFGFQNDKMTLGELQIQYYSEFSIEELEDIEASILDKLRNSSVLKEII